MELSRLSHFFSLNISYISGVGNHQYNVKKGSILLPFISHPMSLAASGVGRYHYHPKKGSILPPSLFCKIHLRILKISEFWTNFFAGTKFSLGLVIQSKFSIFAAQATQNITPRVGLPRPRQKTS